MVTVCVDRHPCSGSGPSASAKVKRKATRMLYNTSTSRWQILSLARFILSLIVIIGHIASFITVGKGWPSIGLWLNQGSAVFGFLVISGYSIAASLDSSERNFIARRIVRIYPTYLLSLMFAALVGAMMQTSVTFPDGTVISKPTWQQFVVMIVMLQTFVAGPVSTNGVLWSLAVEWWNYMFAPFIKNLRTPILLILLASSLAYNVLSQPYNAAILMWGKSFFCISWYWLVGFIYYRHRRTPVGYAILFIPLLFAYSSGTPVGRAVIIGFSAVALCDEVQIPIKYKSISGWLGDISYPIYAFHFPVMIFATILHVVSGEIMFIATILVSAISLNFIESPIHKWFYNQFALVKKRVDGSSSNYRDSSELINKAFEN